MWQVSAGILQLLDQFPSCKPVSLAMWQADSAPQPHIVTTPSDRAHARTSI